MKCIFTKKKPYFYFFKFLESIHVYTIRAGILFQANFCLIEVNFPFFFSKCTQAKDSISACQSHFQSRKPARKVGFSMFNANFCLRFIRCKYELSSRFGSKVIRRARGRLNKMNNEQFSIQEKYSKEGKRDFAHLISGKEFIMLPTLMNF